MNLLISINLYYGSRKIIYSCWGKITGAIKEFFSAISNRIQQIRTEVLSIFEKDHDIIGRVLKCHLMIESYLDKTIIYYNKDNLAIDKIRLTFNHKVELLQPKMDENRTYFKGIRELNRLRNKFAHNLSAEILIEDVQHMRFYAETYLQRRSDSTIEIIEKFSLVAAALLANQLDEEFGDLSKLYATLIDQLSKDPVEYQKFFSDERSF